jgi:nitroreductase
MKTHEILDAFNFRHACKQFDIEKKISDEDFNLILETGRLSPSSFGFEPWHFIVIQNMDKRKALSKTFWGGDGKWQTASHLVFVLARKDKDLLPGSDFLNHMMNDIHALPADITEYMTAAYKKFLDEDFGLTKYPQGIADWSIRQTYIPLANMMNTAAMLKIDSCPMEGFNREEMDNVLSSEFGFDKEQYTLSYAVAFGYRVADPKRAKARQPMDDIVTWIK